MYKVIIISLLYFSHFSFAHVGLLYLDPEHDKRPFLGSARGRPSLSRQTFAEQQNGKARKAQIVVVVI